MAEIVLGIGASHGPLLSTPPEKWDLRAKADRENKSHWYWGKSWDYEALLKERAPGQLTCKFSEVAPEAIVILGNDQVGNAPPEEGAEHPGAPDLANPILASGGLTHFVLDEELDRNVVAAIEKADEETLARIPENIFKVGTAEIKNWYPVISAMNAEGRKYHSVDYVPCYRSEAGTGSVMAFGYGE